MSILDELRAETTTPSEVAFFVGELPRDVLSALADELDVDYTKHTPSDEIRAEVLDAVDKLTH